MALFLWLRMNRWFRELVDWRKDEYSSVQQHWVDLCTGAQQLNNSSAVGRRCHAGRRRSGESLTSCLDAEVWKQGFKRCHAAIVNPPEPAGVLGRRLLGDAGFYHAVLPGAADGASESHSRSGPHLSQFLHHHLREVWGHAGGSGAPQRHHAEPRYHIYRRDTRSVKWQKRGLLSSC